MSAPGAGENSAAIVAVTTETAANLQDEMKELGWEAVRFVAGIAATVVASRIVWHFLNPFRKEEEKAEANRQFLIDRVGKRFEDIETDQHEDQIAAGILVPEDLDVGFDDIAGLSELKRSIKELVLLPFQRPDLFPPGSLVAPPKGVLLYGPPGTGKTMLAKAIAKETDATFINVPLSTLQSQWFGESNNLVRATFSLAKKLAPSIVFIDEIDSFMRTRRRDDHQAVSDMRAEFMAAWDGILTDPNQHVMVLGTTNKADEMDPAMLRRVPRRFAVPLPDEQHRQQILETILTKTFVTKLVDGFDFKAIAAQTEGYSGSDLKEVCKAGALAPLRAFVDSGEESGLRPLHHHDILEAMGTVKPAEDFQHDGALDSDYSDDQQQWQAFASMLNALGAAPNFGTSVRP